MVGVPLACQCFCCLMSLLSIVGLHANKKARLRGWKTQHRSVQITLSSPGKSSLNKINTMRQTVERSHGKFNLC